MEEKSQVKGLECEKQFGVKRSQLQFFISGVSSVKHYKSDFSFPVLEKLHLEPKTKKFHVLILMLFVLPFHSILRIFSKYQRSIFIISLGYRSFENSKNILSLVSLYSLIKKQNKTSITVLSPEPFNILCQIDIGSVINSPHIWLLNQLMLCNNERQCGNLWPGMAGQDYLKSIQI